MDTAAQQKLVSTDSRHCGCELVVLADTSLEKMEKLPLNTASILAI